jgi:hypothetical protein
VCGTRPERKRAAREDRIGESEEVFVVLILAEDGGAHHLGRIDGRRRDTELPASVRKTTGGGGSWAGYWACWLLHERQIEGE